MMLMLMMTVAVTLVAASPIDESDEENALFAADDDSSNDSDASAEDDDTDEELTRVARSSDAAVRQRERGQGRREGKAKGHKKNGNNSTLILMRFHVRPLKSQPKLRLEVQSQAVVHPKKSGKNPKKIRKKNPKYSRFF